MSKRKTAADYWKAIDLLHPKHRMAGQWHEMHWGKASYCSDETPNGWGNFGCKRCDAITDLENRGRKIWPRSEVMRAEAFAAIEEHDIKVGAVYIGGTKQQQKRTLRDLKAWHKVKGRRK